MRRDLFVGRDAEIRRVLGALDGARGAPRVFYLHGLGGAGKSALLSELADRAGARRVAVVRIDGRDVPATIEGFSAALAAGLRGRARRLLLIDTAEALRPLERWIRETLLPELPAGVVTVLATREPPSAEWRSTPGWGRLHVPLPLGNLDDDDARELLSRRRVPPAEHEAAIAFTHGHPLALVLVADVCTQPHAKPFRPEREPELVLAILRRFVHDADEGHRRALEAAAVVRTTTEPLLAALLGDRARAAFAWLRGLSFIVSGPRGLYPHDVVRDALVAELRWRDAPRYAELVERAHAYHASRLARGEGEHLDAAREHLFLSRFAPGVGDVVRWGDAPNVNVEIATERDVPAILAMVRKHEGAASAAIAKRWLATQLDRVIVVRDARGGAAGFVAPLALDRATKAEIAADPAARVAWEIVRRSGRLRRRDVVTHFRFWMAKDSYQSPSEAQSLCMLAVLHHELTTPNLVQSFWPCRRPEDFAALTSHAGSMRVAEADFEVGGRTYGVYMHDWRERSPAEWVASLARKAAGAPTPREIPLDERRLRDAVPEALKSFRSPHDLGRSALLSARFVRARAGASSSNGDALELLRATLRDAVTGLGTTSRGTKLALAVTRTYLDEHARASSQEEVAELLGLPFSTYRRHLTAGVEAVADQLWDLERGLRDGDGSRPAYSTSGAHGLVK